MHDGYWNEPMNDGYRYWNEPMNDGYYVGPKVENVNRKYLIIVGKVVPKSYCKSLWFSYLQGYVHINIHRHITAYINII